MGALTSPDIALSVLLPLPFCIVAAALRFRIRLQRKAWGADDWAMLVNLPLWTIAVVALLGMSWSGIGAPDASLSEEQMANSLRWFYVFQEPWCFTLISIKWSIGFALLRIASGQRWIEIIIYTCLAVVTLSMGGTGMYLFFQCSPVQKNWFTTIPGECQPREIQTALSFLVAAVSITTDWIFATLPIFLLWNIQMNMRVKLSVVGMLGLGVFASIAPIVRLKYLIGLNDPNSFIQNLGLILAWASAEQNVGMLVANLPACRPLLEKMVSKITSLSGSKHKSSQYPAGSAAGRNYLELAERDAKRAHTAGGKSSGLETRIYGRDMNDLSSDSLPDDGSQKQIVAKPSFGAIRVQQDFGVSTTNKNEGAIV